MNIFIRKILEALDECSGITCSTVSNVGEPLVYPVGNTHAKREGIIVALGRPSGCPTSSTPVASVEEGASVEEEEEDLLF